MLDLVIVHPVAAAVLCVAFATVGACVLLELDARVRRLW